MSADTKTTPEETRHDQLRGAEEQAGIAVLVANEERQIEYVNSALLEHITGYRSSELIGKPFDFLFGTNYDAAFFGELWRELRRSGCWRGQLICITRHSSQKAVEVTLYTVAGLDEESIHAAAFLRDVTEDQKHAAQARQSQKFEAIGQLASGIAHEINTPTQYIGDNIHFFGDAYGSLRTLLEKYAELLEWAEQQDGSNSLTAEIRRLIEKIDLEFLLAEMPDAISRSIEGNRRVAEVVRAMKEFAHPSTEDPTLTDINHAIENTISVSRNEWKYVAELETQFAPDMPMVPCVLGAVNQVLLNIIVNAAHAISDVEATGERRRGKITISTHHEPKWAEIRIADTGTGIPPHVGERMYNPFFTTKDVGKGTGQGLAIARSLVEEAHKGTIEYETEVGKGTTFIIRLPLTLLDEG